MDQLPREGAIVEDSVTERVQLRVVARAKRRFNDARPQLVNLSKGALVVRADTLLEPGAAVDVSLCFDEARQEIQIQAEVVWANQQIGDMALRFVEISSGDEELINDFLVIQKGNTI